MHFQASYKADFWYATYKSFIICNTSYKLSIIDFPLQYIQKVTIIDKIHYNMYPIIRQNNYRIHVLLSMIVDLQVSDDYNDEFIAYKSTFQYDLQTINPQLSRRELYDLMNNFLKEIIYFGLILCFLGFRMCQYERTYSKR